MEFTEPPPTNRSKSRAHWAKVTDALRANPGQWAFVGNFTPGVATHIRNGKFPAFLDPKDPSPKKVYMKTHWEITTRRTDPKHNDIFIRWIG